MLEYVYSLCVWPFQACIEMFNVLFYKIFNDVGMSIMVSSFFLSIMLMPFYSIKAANLSEKSSGKYSWTKKIKVLFSVVKPYLFIIFYALLFAASYIYYVNVYFEDTPRLIKAFDLSKPDGNLGTLFPAAMLVFGIIAAVIPVIMKKKNHLQSILLAVFFIVIFIILGKNSIMLGLFWAVAALFLCIKNTFDSMKHPSRWYRGIILLGCVAVTLAVIDRFRILKPIFSAVLLAITLTVALVTAFISTVKRFFDGQFFYSAEGQSLTVYRYSCIVLFLLAGLAIPLLLFASSPEDFNSIGTMLLQTVFQSASVFLIAAFFYWEFSSRVMRRFLLVLMPFIVMFFLISAFVFPGDYGIITSNFVFEEWKSSPQIIELVMSIAAVLVPALLVCCLIRFKKVQWLKNGLAVVALSLVIISGINAFSIIREHNLIKSQQASANNNDTQVFTFSKTGENVFVLFLDRATGFSIPDALKLDPKLEDSLDGFIWYPNTVSYGDYTITAYPAMIGGYEYRTLELNKRLDEPLKDKVNEAIKVLPKIFGDAGYNVMITDPSYADLQGTPNTHIFDGMNNVHSRNIKGIFRNRYDQTQNPESRMFYNTFYYDISIRFSLFRMLPPIARPLLYYNGKWLKNTGASSYIDLVDLFPNLLYLEDLCNVVQKGGNLNIMMNETVHRKGAHNRNLELVSEPIVLSEEEIDEYGSASNAEHTYTFSAALSAVGNWCEWLKREGIYDNTKIIVVSDHGKSFGGTKLHSGIAERRNPLLMVKDFNSRGPMITSNTFMTNADMPAIAVSSLAANNLGKVINPFTGNEISSTPKKGEILIVDGPVHPQSHKRDTFVINNIWELKNQNIFDSKNWVKVEQLE